MGDITLIYGLPFSGQRERLISLLAERISSSPGEPVYVLVPTHQAAVKFRDSLLKACPSEALIGVRVETIDVSARELYSLLVRPERPMMTFERELIVGSLLEDVRFPNLKMLGDFRGVRRRLAGFISLVKRNLLSHEQVNVALNSKGRGKREWEGGLPAFLRAYDERLRELALMDPDELLSVVSGALESGELAPPDGPLVAVYGFFHLCASELSYVKLLLARAEQGVVVVDHHPDANERLEASKALFEAMREVASDEVCIPVADGRARSLMAAEGADEEGEGITEHVELAQAFDIRSEVELVARSVKEILGSDPALAPSSVKIVANDLDVYGPLFGETFSRYGIPLSIPAGKRLDESPVVAAALSLLEAPLQNFSRHSVLRILSMPFVEVASTEGRLDRELVDRIARASRVVEGYEEWRSRLEELRNLLRAGSEIEPEYPDPVDQEIDRLRAEPGAGRYERIMAALLDMLARLKSMDEVLTPEEFCKRCVEQLEHFGVTRSALAPEDCDGEAKRLNNEAALALSRFLRALRELVTALEECSPAARGLSDYYRMLRAAISFERVDEAEAEHEAVELHWGSQSATIPAEYVFVVGATESSFPGVEAKVTLHSAEELREMGFVSEPRHQAQSRFLFYSYLASAKRKARVSWPASDGGNAFLRSPFVDEIETSAKVISQEGRIGGEAPKRGTLGDICIWLGEKLAVRPAEMETAPFMAGLRERYPMAAEGMLRAFTSLQARAASPGRNPYDGMIASPDLLDALRVRFTGAAFGVTRLEAYARCPFRFFVENVLDLLPPAEPEESVSPLNWGSAVHRALQRFMAGRRSESQGRVIFRAIPRPEEDADGFGAAIDELTALLDEELARLPHRADDAYYLSMRENLLGAAALDADGGFAEAFLREEAVRQALGFAPAHFEVYFGPSAPPESADKLLSGPSLALCGTVSGEKVSAAILGKIDRLDLVGGSGAVIYDYKTGAAAPPGLRDIREGTALQLPLYLLVATEMLRRGGMKEATPYGATYLRARDSRSNAASFILRARPLPGDAPGKRAPDEAKFQESLVNSLRFALSYAHGIASGLFPPVPKSGRAACRYCDYRAICRRADVGLFEAEFPVSVEEAELDSYTMQGGP